MALHKIFWIILLSYFAALAAARHTDCEVTPDVQYATYKVEDNDDMVTAIYKCRSGYELKGESEITCDLDTDEWLQDPPTCEKVNSGDEETDDENIEIEQAPPKKKLPDIPEDRFVTREFALRLDMSCISARVKAPTIENGQVVKYDRRKKEGQLFLVAFYKCNDNFDFEDPDINAVYCSKKNWIGELPTCASANGDDYDNGDGNDYEEGDEDGDDEKETNTAHHNGRGTHLQHEHEEHHEESHHSTSETHHKQEHTEGHQEHSTVQSEGTSSQPAIISHTPNTENVEGRISDYEKQNFDEYEKNEPGLAPATTAVVVEEKSFNEACDEYRGGCDHKCRMIPTGDPNNPAEVECSCLEGFYLDNEDKKRCLDVNECEMKNGGCEQICTNLPGSHQCSCEGGLQIDTTTGNTCVDINECQDEEISSKCQYGCENLQGSYRCLEPQTASIIETNKNQYTESSTNVDNEEEEDEHEVRSNNLVEETNLAVANVVIDKKLCEDGFRRSPEDKCVDIDECAEGLSGCEHCENTDGGFECTCPNGYELKEDERTCQDINECEMYSNGEEDENEEEAYRICSHACVNSMGSYLCKCPDNYHLHTDQRTCLLDYCEDLTDKSLNKMQCSHDCINDPEKGYRCLCPNGYILDDSNNKTCISTETISIKIETVDNRTTYQESDEVIELPTTVITHHQQSEDKCTELNGNHLCYPGQCINDAITTEGYRCECPQGYATKEGRCHDIDECSTGEHKCSHNCENRDGYYECSCPSGLNLSPSDNYKTCIDVNECETQPQICGIGKNCENTHGSYKCICPEGQQIQPNGECKQHTKVLEITPCFIANGGCSHICRPNNQKAHPHDVICECPDGMELSSENNKLCINKNPCNDNNNGGCSQICNPNFVNGEHCQCQEGFVLADDKKTCFDVNECKNKNGGCSHLCKNLEAHSCPRLPQPKYGTILPSNCITGNIFSGERCLLHCPPGMVPAGKRAAICNSDKTWSTNSTLDCIYLHSTVNVNNILHSIGSGSVGSTGSSIINNAIGGGGGGVSSSSGGGSISTGSGSIQISSSDSSAIQPFINCPQDTILLLPEGQKNIFIRLQQPKTNVDYFKYVDAQPEWAKNLDGHLPAGVHIIRFRARSPNSNLSAMCRTVITVKESHPPKIIYCPPSYEIQLNSNEAARSIKWKEPVFESNNHLKQIYKSKSPGEIFAPGIHNILYIATDRDGQSSRCEFKLIVRANSHFKTPSVIFPSGNHFTTSGLQYQQLQNQQQQQQQQQEQQNLQNHQRVPYHTQQQQQHQQLSTASKARGIVTGADGTFKATGLANHESYLICAGKPAMKIETNYPVQVPVNCYVKNIRKEPLLVQQQLSNRRRHQRHHLHNMNHQYPAWNYRPNDLENRLVYFSRWH